MIDAEQYYLRIWLSPLKKYKVSVFDGALLTLIYTLSTKRGYCYASKQKLAEILRVSTVTIFKRLAKLKGMGLVTDFVPESGHPYDTSCLQVTDEWRECVESLTEKARFNDWESFQNELPI
jgi:biotin operon repressor